MRRPLLLPAIASALLLGGCQQIGVLHPRGPVGEAERTILLNSLYIMLAIIVPTIVATLGFAWWYRESNSKATYRPDWAYSGRVELLVWSIPLLTITFLGGIAWVGSHDLDPFRPLQSSKPALRVQVVSLDWKWLFIYPDQNVASINELAVEAGRPVDLSLTSASVMNSFFVPQLGTMIYTMNGMTTQLHLQADAPGEFEGLSTHLSGDGFSDMRFAVKALDPGGLEGWIANARKADATLDRARYAELSKQTTRVAPTFFKAVEPNLFEGITSQAIPPGPGPDAGRSDTAVSPKSSRYPVLGPICTPAAPRGETASASPVPTAPAPETPPAIPEKG